MWHLTMHFIAQLFLAAVHEITIIIIIIIAVVKIHNNYVITLDPAWIRRIGFV